MIQRRRRRRITTWEERRRRKKKKRKKRKEDNKKKGLGVAHCWKICQWKPFSCFLVWPYCPPCPQQYCRLWNPWLIFYWNFYWTCHRYCVSTQNLLQYL